MYYLLHYVNIGDNYNVIYIFKLNNRICKFVNYFCFINKRICYLKPTRRKILNALIVCINNVLFIYWT